MGKGPPLPTALPTECYGQMLLARHQQNNLLILESFLKTFLLQC
jgi:hypothetical protein